MKCTTCSIVIVGGLSSFERPLAAFSSRAPILSEYVFRVKIRVLTRKHNLGGYQNPPLGGQQDRAHWKKISASRRRTDFVLGSMDASWYPEQKSNQVRKCQITPSPPKRSFSAFSAIFQNFSIGCSGLKLGWIRCISANVIWFKLNLFFITSCIFNFYR